MKTECVCMELRLLVPDVISVSCVRARCYVVWFVLYILFYYCLYVLSPCCGVRYNFRKRLFCWSLSLLFVVQFMSYCDVCLRILMSNIMPYHTFFRFCFSVVFSIKRFLVHSYPPLFVGGLISYVCYLCLFVSSDIQHVLTRSCMAGVLSIKGRSCLLFASTCMVHPRFLGSVANFCSFY